MSILFGQLLRIRATLYFVHSYKFRQIFGCTSSQESRYSRNEVERYISNNSNGSLDCYCMNVPCMNVPVYIRGYHAYQDVWYPFTGEVLHSEREPENLEDVASGLSGSLSSGNTS